MIALSAKSHSVSVFDVFNLQHYIILKEVHKMSNAEVVAPSWLTTEYLQKMLQNFFNDNSVILKNFKMAPESAVGNNYVGQISRIELEFTKQNQVKKRSIISKLLLETKIVSEFKRNFDHGATEMKMMEMLPLLHKELCDKSDNERFYPLVYHFDVKNKIIFMEDLCANGYILADRKSSTLDLDHVLLVTRALAKMHATSYLLFKKEPDHKNKFLDYYWKNSRGLFPGEVMNVSFNYLLKYLHLWPISEEDKKIFSHFEGKIADIMTEANELKESSFNALLHGDCWSSNLMFKYNKNGKVESVKMLDYQLSYYNSIGLDLNFFLFTSSANDVKINHLEDVFATYYDSFVNVTGEIKGFTVDTVRQEFTERLGFGFVMGIIFRFIMTAENGFDFDSYLQGNDSPTNDAIYNRKGIISETAELLPLFKKHGIFKIKS